MKPAAHIDGPCRFSAANLAVGFTSFTSAKNRLQSDADSVLLVPADQAFRFHVSLPQQAGVGSGWMSSFR